MQHEFSICLEHLLLLIQFWSFHTYHDIIALHLKHRGKGSITSLSAALRVTNSNPSSVTASHSMRIRLLVPHPQFFLVSSSPSDAVNGVSNLSSKGNLFRGGIPMRP